MSFVDEILKRASVQGLTEYLLAGDPVEVTTEVTKDYGKRVYKAYRDCMETAEKYGLGEQSDMVDTIIKALDTYENVYMEVGVLAGFLLAREMSDKEGRWE